MIFEKLNYAVIILIFAVVYLFLRSKYYRTFFNKVNNFWFYNVSKLRKLSQLFYIAFILLGVVAIADLRGEEKVIEANLPTQRTMVLIDTSLSMLVEDVRPNRINKAVLIARHFIRNSFGHQVSLSVFADIFKQIVPFTDDIEILEARLQTITQSQPEGGSNISFSVKEAIQFFKNKNGYLNGNIVLITDGEEQDKIDLEVPDEINLVVIGLGSEKGGKIPLRKIDGQFIRNKTHNSQEVISKINKSFFESISKSGKNVKVWLTQSYGMPTEEILAFLSKIHENNYTKGNMRQRPVLGLPLIISFIVFYILYVIFSRFKTFSIPVLIIFSLLTLDSVKAQDGEEEKKVNPEVTKLLEKYKNGEITKSEKLKLANLFLKENESEKARMLYSENLKDLKNAKVEDLFNFATSLLKEKKYSDGIELYKYLDKERDITPEQREIIRKNLLHALNAESKNQDGKSDKQNEEDKDKDKDDKNEDKDKDKKDKQSKKGKGQKDKDKKDSKDKDQNKDKDKDDKSDDGKDEDKDKKEDNKDNEGDKKQEETKKKTWEDIRKETELKKKQGTVKGVLKQIMNDDSNLQKKFINSKSSDNSQSKKDW